MSYSRVTPNQRKKVYERDGFVCLRCGRDCLLTIDHINPVKAGGGWLINNYQTLCQPCNEFKGKECIDFRITKPDPTLIIDVSKVKLNKLLLCSNTLTNKPKGLVILRKINLSSLK